MSPENGTMAPKIPTSTARPYETGEVPPSCPCGRPLPDGVGSLTEMLRNAATLGRKGITCGGCARRWSVESLPAGSAPASVARNAPASSDIDLSANTLIIAVSLHKPGQLRAVRQSLVEVKSATGGEDPKARATRVRKVRWDHETYDAICSHDNGTYEGLKGFALPVPGGRFLRPGWHLVPSARVADATAWLDARAKEREELVRVFAGREYAGIVEEARRTLGDLFSASDYPQDVTPLFQGPTGAYIEVTYPSETVNRALQTLDPVRFARAQAESAANREALVGEVRNGMRQVLATFCNDLAERIGAKQKGETKRFVASKMLEEMKGWLANFEKLNVLGDAELEALAQSARKMLDGVEAEDISVNQSVAARVKDGMDSITAAVKSLGVEPKPVRKFTPRKAAE